MTGLALSVWAGVGCAATVLFSPLDSLQGWSMRTSGPADVRFVPIGQTASGVELRSQGGTALLSRELPVEAVAGCRVQVSCLVKNDDVAPGPQPASTAKLHLAVATPRGVRHFSARFAGTGPWRQEGLVADVPGDATRAVLNLGLEVCSGRLSLARLSVRNNRRGVWPLPLDGVVNARHEQLGISAFPKDTITWQGIPFRITEGAVGGDCLRLGGEGHRDWPLATASSIPVGRFVSAVYLLHAAIGGRDSAETPCAIWSATNQGGFDVALSLFEGQQIGALGSTADLPQWQVAWRPPEASGGKVSFGVTRWPFHVDSLVQSLHCRAYHGAPVVILAATVVEEAPPKPSIGEDEEVQSEDEDP